MESSMEDKMLEVHETPSAAHEPAVSTSPNSHLEDATDEDVRSTGLKFAAIILSVCLCFALVGPVSRWRLQGTTQSRQP